MEQRITAKRKEHHQTFQETLMTIMKRADKQGEDDTERKKIESLRTDIVKEKENIDDLNKEIDSVEKNIKEVYTNY